MPVIEQVERMGETRNPLILQALKEEHDADPLGDELNPEEWRRILDLPVREPATEADIETFSYKEIDARAYDAGFRLRLRQVDSVREFDRAGGLLAQVRVGAGKTLLSVSIATRALKGGANRALILVPAQVYRQLMEIDLPFLRTKMPIGYPFVGLGGMTPARRKEVIRGVRRQAVFVLPYSLLSRTDSRETLAAVAPDVVVADEAHYLKNRSAARTKRFLDFMKSRPECRFVAMSGTLTSKSLSDYHHLAVLALGDKSPLPKGATQGALWAGLLDAMSVATAEKAKLLQPLRVWAAKKRGIETPYTVDGFREAFRARLESAPGCVLTRGVDDLETSLIFETIERDVPTQSKLHELFRDLENKWQSPTGDEIAHAIHLYKWRYELSAGFYYALVWPEPRNDAHREAIDRAKEHHAYLQEYHRQLREFLKYTSIPNLDTPMLVGAGIARHDKKIPKSLAHAWQQAKDREFHGMPEREQSPIRVDDYKIKAAVEWAEQLTSQRGNTGGIIWVHHHEMLEWICEAIPAAKPARAGEMDILKHEHKDRIWVASMRAHGTGKNLQHFQNQLFVQWPRAATEAEQVLGRIHRPGQTADEITAHLLMGIEFDHQLFCATLSDALYIQLTTGAEQKLLYGSYATPPKIYDPRLLDKLGFQGSLKKLEADKLKERFGA